MNLALFFYVWEDAKIWLLEITPLICTSAIWGQNPAFLHPESLQVHSWGRLQWLRAWWWGAACLSPG